MVGGLETVVQVLVIEWSRLGHEVTVITDALNAEPDTFIFKVLRRASFFDIVQAVRRGDVFVHANVSLWGLLPWLFCGLRRPAWVATHHGWYFLLDKPVRWRDRLKIWLTHRASANISVSEAVNRHLGNPGVIVPNPYNNRTFCSLPYVALDSDLVFLGRLVSDKGVDVLLDALALLRLQGRRPSLTIIGSGPEETALREQTVVLALTEQVTFAGPKHAQELSKMLNAHRIMVIPSRCHEGFGVVALEGIACGCIVVGANSGGLPEAIGPCGLIFPMGDARGLASHLECLLANDSVCQELRSHANLHLVGHQPGHIAKRYLDIFQMAINQ